MVKARLPRAEWVTCGDAAPWRWAMPKFLFALLRRRAGLSIFEGADETLCLKRLARRLRKRPSL